jgi:hypothetical protein
MDLNQIVTIVAASVPTMITVLIGILINNSRLGDLRWDMNSRFGETNRRIDDLRVSMDVRFEHVNSRFDHMERQFDSKLGRVEDVMDARLKHMEER